MTIYRIAVRCFSLLDGSQKRAWWTLIPLAVTVGILEALGAGLVFAWIHFVNETFSASATPTRSSLIIESLIARLPWHEEAARLLIVSGLLAAFFIFKNTLRYFEVRLVQTRAQAAIHSVSSQLLEMYLKAPYHFHFAHNSANLIRKVSSSVQITFREVALSLVAVISEALVILALAVTLVVMAPAAALITLLLLGSVLAFLLPATQRRFSLLGRQTQEKESATAGWLQQSLGAVKEVKVLGKELFFSERFGALRSQVGKLHQRQGELAVIPRLLVETLFICAGVCVVGAILLTSPSKGAEVLPTLALFAYACLRVLPSLHLLVYHLNTVRFGAAAVDEVHGDWQKLEKARLNSTTLALLKNLEFKHQVEFLSVTYNYSNSENNSGRENAIKGITTQIKHGEFVGLVGVTGAGKSTFVDLLLGLLIPTIGSVRVDGLDLHAHPETVRSWLAKIGYVPQASYLIDDSLRRNIALGLSDLEIDEGKLQSSVELAQLTEFVSSLPEGLSTPIGERGMRLSGGQRQRVAIARALYRGSEVLIFDEATSSLDDRTEMELSQALDHLVRKKTVIVVAHRPNTMRRCDRLLMLENGRLIAEGPFENLLASCEQFRQLVAPSSK